jgi:hypothetical protein
MIANLKIEELLRKEFEVKLAEAKLKIEKEVFCESNRKKWLQNLSYCQGKERPRT